jgi:hypothetical protein
MTVLLRRYPILSRRYLDSVLNASRTQSALVDFLAIMVLVV